MPKASPRAGTETVSLSQTVDTRPRSIKKLVFEARWKIGAVALVLLVGLGVMAKNGWLGSSSPPYEGGVDAPRGRGGSLLSFLKKYAEKGV